MKIAIVYVFAPVGGEGYINYAMRFLDSYYKHPPGLAHETIIVLNGTKVTSEIACLFSSLPRCHFLEHDNSGYDIGAFQFAARSVSCDMMVFFGASTFFKREGWLIRMADAFQKHGQAVYGAMGNRGDLDVKVWPHLRTTAFWCSPELMNAYPTVVKRPEQRHPFEHGKDNFTEWVRRQGLKAWVVTWGRELLWKEWDDDPEGYGRGSQSNLLAGDRMCEYPYVKQRA